MARSKLAHSLDQQSWTWTFDHHLISGYGSQGIRYIQPSLKTAGAVLTRKTDWFKCFIVIP